MWEGVCVGMGLSVCLPVWLPAFECNVCRTMFVCTCTTVSSGYDLAITYCSFVCYLV